MDTCIFVNSNGQAGTHMVSRCLMLLGMTSIPLATNEAVGTIPNGHPAWEDESFSHETSILTGVNWPGFIEKDKLLNERFLPHIKPNSFGASHLFYTRAADGMFAEIGALKKLEMKMILIVREPRDWAWSAARKTAEFADPIDFGRSPGWTEDQHLEDFVFGFPPTTTAIGRLSMSERYSRFTQWSRYPAFCMTIRYEDLIGPSGGGSLNTQLQVIRLIAKFANIPVNETKVLAVATLLFGGTETFRRGCIGTWTERSDFFSRQDVIKECVKTQRLADLGYGRDYGIRYAGGVHDLVS